MPYCPERGASERRTVFMMDYDKIKAGIKLMLEGIGEDVNREGLLETPDRIARMCGEIYGGLYEDPAAQIAEALEESLKPQGVIVMLEAEHMCMTMRGIKKPGSKTVTLVTTGVFQDNAKLQERFLALVRQS